MIYAPPSTLVLAETMLNLSRPKWEIGRAVRRHETTDHTFNKKYIFAQWCILRKKEIVRFPKELPLLNAYVVGLSADNYLFHCKKGREKFAARLAAKMMAEKEKTDGDSGHTVPVQSGVAEDHGDESEDRPGADAGEGESPPG